MDLDKAMLDELTAGVQDATGVGDAVCADVAVHDQPARWKPRCAIIKSITCTTTIQDGRNWPPTAPSKWCGRPTPPRLTEPSPRTPSAA